jgi:hypothetical protein
MNSILSSMTRIACRLVYIGGVLKLNEKNFVRYDGADNRKNELPGDVEEFGARKCNDISVNLFLKSFGLLWEEDFI